MIIISSQREPPQDTEHFAGPVVVATLARLGSGWRHRHLGQQAFQQLAAIRQQGGAQSTFDPLGGQRLALCQSLLKQFQEGFGFPVTVGLDVRAFFFMSAAASARVRATVSSTNSSARV